MKFFHHQTFLMGVRIFDIWTKKYLMLTKTLQWEYFWFEDDKQICEIRILSCSNIHTFTQRLMLEMF